MKTAAIVAQIVAVEQRHRTAVTAFTLLQQTNLKITYTSSPAIYVSAINGLKENDIKVGSGWMYSVNGKYVDKSAGDKLIKPGDKVHWYFTVQGFK